MPLSEGDPAGGKFFPHSRRRAFCTRRSFIAVRYAENLMLFKSAAITEEKKNKTAARHPYLQGRKQQLPFPDTSPTSRSRVRAGGGGTEPGGGGSHSVALGTPVPQRGADGLGGYPVAPHAAKRQMLLEWFCGSLLTQCLVQLRHLRVVPACGLGLVAERKREGSQESSWKLSSCHER